MFMLKLNEKALFLNAAPMSDLSGGALGPPWGSLGPPGPPGPWPWPWPGPGLAPALTRKLGNKELPMDRHVAQGAQGEGGPYFIKKH